MLYSCTIGVFLIKYFSGKLCFMLNTTLSPKAQQQPSREETNKKETEIHAEFWLKLEG